MQISRALSARSRFSFLFSKIVNLNNQCKITEKSEKYKSKCFEFLRYRSTTFVT